MKPTNEKYQKACLYDVQWQMLRVGLLASNNDYGGFGTMEGVLKNIEILEEYRSASWTSDESARRNWRILNLLNAVLLGYGRTIGEDDARRKEITTYRNRCSEYHNMHWAFVTEKEWDWYRVELELEQVRKHNPERFKEIYANLMQRVGTAKRKEKKGTGGMQWRSELRTFLDLMEKFK